MTSEQIAAAVEKLTRFVRMDSNHLERDDLQELFRHQRRHFVPD